MANKREILIFESSDKMADFALKKWREISGRAIKDRDRFTVAVSGGKAPVGFYQKLVGCKSDLSWDKTHVFLVDERFVPFDDAESNYGMIKDKLFNRVKIPAENVHPISTREDIPQVAAEKYERDLKILFELRQEEFPVFDLVMLGMGEDGHTASLFPGDLSLTENKHLAIETDLSTLKHRRISLTLPVINNAKNIIFLVVGGNKAGVLKQVIEGKNSRLPAAMVRPEGGEIFFLVDRDAAALLSGEEGKVRTIDNVEAHTLKGKKIMVGEHCLSCTSGSGSGSGCQGALTGREENKINSSEVFPNSMDSLENVKAYYGKVLKSKQDLKTSACCSTGSLPPRHKEILSEIDSEILDKFYGCGSPLPGALDNCVVLDLGCGTGRDVYLASRLVGRDGFVIGVDMTEEQLVVARRHVTSQMEKFGFSKSNVEFRKGYIEDLKGIGIGDNSVDVVISNCVINLSPDKKKVFEEIFRVLKPGGELYFSDVFAGCRVPEHLKADPVLYGECLAGALYFEDFRRILRSIGCADYRVVSKRKIFLSNPELEVRVGMIDFYALTIRAFKLAALEDICEAYGQVAVYSGNIPEYPREFVLDDRHVFITKKPMLVCGNTAAMLQETRYAKHFQVIGDRSIHYGPFDCAPTSVKMENEDSSPGGIS